MLSWVGEAGEFLPSHPLQPLASSTSSQQPPLSLSNSPGGKNYNTNNKERPKSSLPAALCQPLAGPPLRFAASLTPRSSQAASRGGKLWPPPFPCPLLSSLRLSASLLPSSCTWHPRMSEVGGHSESVPSNLLTNDDAEAHGGGQLGLRRDGQPAASPSGALPSIPGGPQGCPPLPSVAGGASPPSPARGVEASIPERT